MSTSPLVAQARVMTSDGPLLPRRMADGRVVLVLPCRVRLGVQARREAILDALRKGGALNRAALAVATGREDDRTLGDDLQLMRRDGLVTCDGRLGRTQRAFWRVVEARA